MVYCTAIASRLSKPNVVRMSRLSARRLPVRELFLLPPIAPLLAAGLTVLGLWAVGCQPAATETAAVKSTDETADSAASASDPPTVAAQETWDVMYMQGRKVGYQRTSRRNVERDGRELVEYESELHLSVERSKQRTDSGLELTSLETSDGRLLSFTSTNRMGQQPAITVGAVHDGQLLVETDTAGKVSSSETDFPDQAGGFLALEQSLARQPMKPGEKRQVLALEPLLNMLVAIELAARDFESTELLCGTYDLLRIDERQELTPGNLVEGTLWVDRTGQILKAEVPIMQQVAYRATREVALDEADAAAFDLGRATEVRLDKPLPAGHKSRHVRYQVELESGDPARVFVSDGTQQVESTGPHTAVVTVTALPLNDPPPASALASAAPTTADVEPSDLVQSDDARIVAMAHEAIGDEQGPRRMALALEGYVHDKMRARQGYATAFASASEVAQSLSGDCTEHAVLLAALARAVKIPSRVAMGLVYVPQDQTFAYHLWTEVYVDRCWLPIDATLGQGGIGAAHLKLGVSSLSGPHAYVSFLPLARVLGRLKIEVLGAE